MRRRSSPTPSSSRGKGRGAAVLRILRPVRRTSMSPVAMLGFLLSRSATTPSAASTNSLRTALSLVSSSGSAVSSLATSCTRPQRSRRSRNTREPRLRTRRHQPSRRTVWPTWSRRRSPLRWVRWKSPSRSSFIALQDRIPRGGAQAGRKDLHEGKVGWSRKTQNFTEDTEEAVALSDRTPDAVFRVFQLSSRVFRDQRFS